MSVSSLNLSQIRNEFVAGDNLIPYEYHYSKSTIKTDDDTLIRIYEISGLLFETADNEQINAWHRQLCQALLGIGISSSNFAIWHWTIKEEDSFSSHSSFAHKFSADFLNQYAKNINETKYYSTRQFLAICLKSPFKIPKTKLGQKRRQDTLNDCEEKLDEITSDLRMLQHGIELMTTYEFDGHSYSAALEVLFRILNGYWNPVPLNYKPIKEYLATSRLLFGTDAYEIRTPDKQIYGAGLGFRQYLTPTNPVMLQNILRLNFPITLCQSFIYEDQNKSAGVLEKTYRQMKLSKDAPEGDIHAMEHAIDQLKSGQIFFGSHHLSLFIYAVGYSGEDTHALRRRLTDRVSQAKQTLQQVGVVVAREDIALPSAHYAQLPANQIYRPRVASIHTRNLASFIPMHTTPLGSEMSLWKTRDNINQELLAFKSTSGGLYRFNCHIGELGHSLIIGASGSGKTVLMGALTSQFDKYGTRVIIFDKDCGQEILVRALGGEYHNITRGHPSGLNPYSLPATPENLNFILKFTLKLAYPKDDYSAQTENELSAHLRSWYANKTLPSHLRRISELRKGLQDVDLKDRLMKWTNEGQMGWLFDNAEDNFNIQNNQYIGIDTTDILDDYIGRTPFFMYLTHRVEQALDGSRTVVSFDEMWKMLSDTYFEGMIKDWLKTLRKKNGMMIGATQDAEDISKSAISSTILSQCPTHIFYANPKANAQDYDGFSLTRNELTFIKEANPKHRLLLIKQETSSVIVNFSLFNMEKYLAVISGRTENVKIARQCIEEAGNDPKNWLPIFYNRYSLE